MASITRKKTYFDKYVSEAVFKYLSQYINLQRVLSRKLEFKRTTFEYNFIIKELYETELMISVLEKIISNHYSIAGFTQLIGKNHVWLYSILDGRSYMSAEDVYLFKKFLDDKFNE